MSILILCTNVVHIIVFVPSRALIIKGPERKRERKKERERECERERKREREIDRKREGGGRE